MKVRAQCSLPLIFFSIFPLFLHFGRSDVPLANPSLSTPSQGNSRAIYYLCGSLHGTILFYFLSRFTSPL